MESVVWETTCSVEAGVSSIFAWNYWTNSGKGVENWNDPPAEFSLDGPFEKMLAVRRESPVTLGDREM
jgi:hypothetical protein